MTARREARRDMRVAIVGAGVMAEAMIAGLLADKAVAASRLVASHPRRDRRELLAARHGITMVTRNAEAVPGADIVVLAVKPQMLRSRHARGRTAPWRRARWSSRSWPAPPCAR